MSRHFPSERFDDLRRHAGLLVQRTREFQDHVELLLWSAEQDLGHAKAAASHTAPDEVDEARRLLCSHVQRTVAGVAAARQLCVHGREQHAEACRLLSTWTREDPENEHRPNAVLVVDDYGEVRQLVSDVLESAGFVVSTAANGLEGLIAAYELRPDVIVMDVSMPVLDGIEATRLIKASKATRDARVIAYTGNPSLDPAVVGTLFAAVLQKPASPAAVLATVQRMASL